VVRWVHGPEAAEAAAAATAALFPTGAGAGARGGGGAADCRTRRGVDDVARLAALVQAAAAGGAAEVTLPHPSVVGVPVVDLCVTSGLVPSKSAGRRLLQGGGLSVNEQRCDPQSDLAMLVKEDDVVVGGEGERFLLLRSGKKTHRIVWVAD
jgi:tyrosyl-tRNA synthetase